MKTERTVTALLNLKGRVFVYLANEAIAEQFMRNAEAECFTFGDGVKPTERKTDSIIAVNKDHTINYVGFGGHVAFGCARVIDGQLLRKVDYIRYVLGERRYLM